MEKAFEASGYKKLLKYVACIDRDCKEEILLILMVKQGKQHLKIMKTCQCNIIFANEFMCLSMLILFF